MIDTIQPVILCRLINTLFITCMLWDCLYKKEYLCNETDTLRSQNYFKIPAQSISPYWEDQSHRLQCSGSSCQDEGQCGRTLLSDEWSEETRQRESQKHWAAQQHVQERAERRTGKRLHSCLCFNLGKKTREKV